MSDSEKIGSEIRRHLLSEYLPGEDPASLTNDLNLRDSGVLDSVNMLVFVEHLEAEYSIKISPHDMASQMGTVSDIVGLVMKKRR